MLEEELFAVLRLQATPNVGDIIAKKLIRNVGSAQQVFKEKASSLLKIDGIGAFAIQHLQKKEVLKKVEKEIDYLQKGTIQYTYFIEDSYPEKLKHCIDGPLLLFHDGNMNWNHEKIISIVGTRNLTNYGRSFCNDLVAKLTTYNPIIISGYAYGTDICAHKAAMENNLQTIAVLAHGLDDMYPKSHKKHMRNMMENGGFITEFWHNEKPFRENFLKRNRIVAGMSQATIIIESAEKGGSLVTADIANSYNRDVFALPGRFDDAYSIGCNNLIKNNQAHLLNSAEDIVKMLNWDIPKKPDIVQPKLFIDLTTEEQKVYDYLVSNGKQLLDIIALDCEIPVYKLSSLLIQMELKGAVKPLPGKVFEV
jgi:DNA processing protein